MQRVQCHDHSYETTRHQKAIPTPEQALNTHRFVNLTVCFSATAEPARATRARAETRSLYMMIKKR